ncbi:hypothetical protein [uncultured Croceitalea sp.]|uniref:hypothetical protein n=1 Tax=uncultured Croceitalea sp. TaxID=1798908 RepID=UPI00330601B1
MIRALLMLLISFGSFHAASQNVSAVDSIEIADKISDWNKAWKLKDPVLAAKWYTEKADFTNAFGFTMIGKSAIEPYLTEVFGFDFVMAGNTEQTSLKLKSISKNAILAITTVERKGQQTVDKKSLGTRNTTHYRLFEKTNGWFISAHLISDARNTESEKH